VLVIIGLIVGGIMVGGEMIKVAEIRSLVNQEEKFKTAAAAFFLKYNCIPGDCPNASTYGFTSWNTNVINGDGNGIIGETTGSISGGWPIHAEQGSFWDQLRQAGFSAYQLS
jgi:hypothetical protein